MQHRLDADERHQHDNFETWAHHVHTASTQVTTELGLTRSVLQRLEAGCTLWSRACGVLCRPTCVAFPRRSGVSWIGLREAEHEHGLNASAWVNIPEHYGMKEPPLPA